MSRVEQRFGAIGIENRAGVDFSGDRNETRAGKFALISPVMTSTDGRCVASTR